MICDSLDEDFIFWRIIAFYFMSSALNMPLALLRIESLLAS